MRNQLFLELKTLSSTYSTRPSSLIDYHRLIKGLPAFVHYALSEQKKMKKLLISHHVKSLNHQDQLLLAYQLIRLHQEGFEIYFENENRLIPYKEMHELRDEVKHLMKIFEDSTSVKTENAERFFAEQLECTGDDIYLFDKLGMERLIQEGQENWRDYNHLDEGLLKLEGCPLNIISFQRLMFENKDKIKKIYLNHCHFLIDSTQVRPIFTEDFPQLEEIEINDNGLREIITGSKYSSYQLIIEMIQHSPRLTTIKFDSTMKNLLKDKKNKQSILEALLRKPSIRAICFPLDSYDSIELMNSSDFHFEDLEVFDCVGLSIDQAILERLCLSKTLKCLSISLKELSQSTMMLPETLEEFHLSKSEINSQGLAQLLANCPKLKKLTISSCQNIDDEIAGISLSNIEELDLSQVKISSQGLVKLLANCPKLKKLTLNLSQPIGDEIAGISLSNLEVLNLGSTQLSSPGLANLLVNTPKLKILKFSHCVFDIEIKESVILQNLEELELYDCDIHLNVLEQLLANNQKLKKLTLIECYFEGEIKAKLALENLEELILYSFRNSSNILEQLLANASKLKSLTFSHCHLTEGEIQQEIDFPNLTELNFNNTFMIPIHLFSRLLAKAPQIKKLDMRNLEFQEDEKTEIIPVPFLQELDLNTSKISSLALGKLLANASQIKILNLVDCQNIGDEISVDIVLPNLEELGLISSNISSQELRQLLETASQLKKLYLINCKNMGDEINVDIALPNLEELDLSCSNISSQGLGQLLETASQLKKLSLLDCKKIGDEISVDIALPNLEELNLNFSNISLQGLGQLLSNASKLKILDFANCKPIGDEVSFDIALPNLEVLNLGDSEISPELLGKLLANTRKLKKLTLNQIENIEDGKIENKLITGLEEFGLINSNISMPELEKFLVNSPELKKLELRYCHLSGELGDILLSNLSALDLSDSIINLETLKQILANSPQLIRLNLIRCKGIPSKFRQYYSEAEKISQMIDELKDYVPGAEESQEIEESHARVPSAGKSFDRNNNTATEKKGKLDADTAQKKQSLRVKKEFLLKEAGQLQDVEPYQVRHKTYDKLEFIKGPNPFLITSERQDEQHIQLITGERRKKNSLLPEFQEGEDCTYLGRFEMSLTKEWKPLPSVLPNETLKSYFVGSNVQVEIAYSSYHNLYYIRLKDSEKKRQVKTLVEVLLQKPSSQANLTSLPPEIRDLILSFHSYTPKQLPDTSLMSGEEVLRLMIEEKTGACRHRALAFKYQMQMIAPEIPVRMITNDCHAFVEIKYHDEWMKIDLGGYPAELRYQKDLFKSSIESQTDGLEPMIGFFTKPEQTFNELEILSAQERKILIETKDVATLRHELQTICRSTNRSFYYIDHPDELRCLGPFLHRNEDMTGTIIDKPGGALYDYLTTSAQPVLILNLSRFKTSDFVQYNSLFDEEPRIEGLDILRNCKIIGLTDSNIGQDASITSRFELQTEMPIAKAMPKPSISSKATGHVIECCGGLNWESRLIGAWVLDGQSLTFKKGLIWVAIERGETQLVFNNAPLQDPNFIRLMHDISFYNGIFYQGESFIHSSNPIHITYSDYRGLADQEAYLAIVDTHEKKQVLNPDSLSDFIGKYDCEAKSHAIRLKKGWIEENAGQSLAVYLTATLSLSEWQLLMENCRIHRTKLNVVLAPDVTLPAEINLDGEIPRFQYPEVHHTLCVNQKPTDLQDAMFVDISELLSDDLLPRLSRLETSKPQAFMFERIEGFLNTELAAGKTIVLSGDWLRAKNLTHALHDYVLKRMNDTDAKGQLILVQKEQKVFPFMTETRIEELQLEPIKISEKASFQERPKKVLDLLNANPMVILTGATGVGKTYFMNEHYPHAHFGEERIQEWIADKSKQPILFIDEANMSYQQWSMFEGLYQKPPSIFYQGKYHRLTDNHRVVFAGNPLSYGGERQLPSLFRHHPIEVEFAPLTAAELLTQLKISIPIAKVIEPMLAFIFEIESQKVLITPREILMVSQVAEASGDIENVAFTVFKNHLPKEKQKEFERFKPKKPMHFKPKNLKSFVVNTTNQEAVDVLSQHLLIRKNRQGGLGGVILEGEPGVGKSQLVTQMLTEEYHLKEGEDFIRIPVSLGYEKKQKLLLEAFHQGKIAIIDEINASPMMERLLNALLEGHDLENKAAKNPGFMIIGTQNPPTYRGRVQTTLPLKHRLQTVELKEYTHDEMQGILQHIGLTLHQAKHLIQEYEKHQKSLNLCFRDLLRAAKHLKNMDSAQEMKLKRYSMFSIATEESKTPTQKTTPPP